MNDPATILGRMLRNSVEFRRIFFPLRAIAGVLERYSDPAIFYSSDFPDFPLSKAGSLFRLRYRGRYLALTTCHQLDVNGYDYHQLSIFGKTRGRVITSGFVTFPLDQDEQREKLDCVVFDFTPGVEEGALDSVNFLELSEVQENASRGELIASFCIGYPSHRNQIDWESENFEIGANAVWGLPCEPLLKGRQSFKVPSHLHYDPKGMSGGPVFSLYMENDQLLADFSGILTNASPQAFNYLPMSEIVRILNYSTRAEEQPELRS